MVYHYGFLIYNNEYNLHTRLNDPPMKMYQFISRNYTRIIFEIVLVFLNIP